MEVQPAQAAPPAIEMRNVAVGAMRDPAATVIEEVNWTVQAGEYWAVAGLQGSGKSDFLLLTAGVMPPARGEYRLFGELMPIFEDARLAQRLRLGIVFDGGQLLHQLTVSENVALAIRYHRNLGSAEARAEVEPILEALDLSSWAASTPGTISWNWQQRVGLARALALKPEVLLVDSPLAGLDLRHFNWWLDFLDQLSRGHKLLDGRPVTLVVTGADLRPWRGRAHQFAVLQKRRLEVLGAAPQLEAASVELGKSGVW